MELADGLYVQGSANERSASSSQGQDDDGGSDLSDVESLPPESNRFPPVSHTILHYASSLSSDLSSPEDEPTSPVTKRKRKRSPSTKLRAANGGRPSPESTPDDAALKSRAPSRLQNGPRRDIVRGPIARLICCEGCPRAFHLQCLNPPRDVDQAPDSAWYCNACTAKTQPELARSVPPEAPTMFPLFLQLLRTNPRCFELPEDIRGAFQDVTTSQHGEYVDAKFVRPVKYRNGYMLPEYARDYQRTRLADGSVVLCYRCCSRATRTAQIISCDFCPLYWHWDCLDPPMIHPPSAAVKWMCPIHVDHDLPRRRIPIPQPDDEEDQQPAAMAAAAEEMLDETRIAKELFNKDQLRRLCKALTEEHQGNMRRRRRKEPAPTLPDDDNLVDVTIIDDFAASSPSSDSRTNLDERPEPLSSTKEAAALAPPDSMELLTWASILTQCLEIF
ncbi:hypothetical protein RI367_000694 [Sorochytrium milnesiophthora]